MRLVRTVRYTSRVYEYASNVITKIKVRLKHMSTDNKYTLASDFTPLQGEANFPPPIQQEVVGGCHIAPECITVSGGQFVMIEWPKGLPRHDSNRTVRFPHGLIKFGETIEQCAARLVSEQLGMAVDSTKALYIYSYVDEAQHWHIEPLLLVRVSGNPRLPPEASRTILVSGDTLPTGAVWGADTFKEAYHLYIEPAL
jgi:NUDIX domain